jgi:actin-related protein 2
MANPIVVLEINDRYVRAGFLKNNHFPAFEFPAIVGRPLQSQAQGISQADEAPTQEILVGDKCQDSKIRHLLAITHPVHMDIVQSWEDMFHLLDYTFQRLGIDNRIVCHRIFLSIFCIRESDLLNMVQAMFARYHFHSVNLADETLLTLYSCELLTGVVVDVGEAITRITPVFDGGDMARTKCLNLAGRNVTECGCPCTSNSRCASCLLSPPLSKFTSDVSSNCLSFVVTHSAIPKAILKRYSPHASVFLLLTSAASLRSMQVRMMVEELCFVAADPKRETRLAEMTTSHMASYHLCDGRDIKFGAERFQACEVLFQPYLFGIEGSGGLAEEVNCLSRT